MANLVPATAAIDLEFPINGNVIRIHVNNMDAIAFGQIPTGKQVTDETHRLLQIQRAQEGSGGVAMNHDEYSDAVVRQQTVVQIGNNAIFAQILTQIQEMQDLFMARFDDMDARFDGMDARFDGMEARFDGMDARFDGMEARFDGMDARLSANSARFFNFQPNSALNTVPFAIIVKCAPGHPWEEPPAVPNVVFAQGYDVNEAPPANLLPVNFSQLRLITQGNLGEVRQRLRAIHWFYNEPVLALAANANRAACLLAAEALEHFLTHL